MFTDIQWVYEIFKPIKRNMQMRHRCIFYSQGRLNLKVNLIHTGKLIWKI